MAAKKQAATPKKPSAQKATPKKAKTSSAPGESAQAHQWLKATLEDEHQDGLTDPDYVDNVLGDEGDESQPEQQSAVVSDDERPRFVTGGKPGPGRPKGSRNKFAENFISDFYAHWLEHGQSAIDWVYANKPDIYFKGAIAVLPKQMDVRVSEFSELTDDALDERLEQLRVQMNAAVTMLSPKGPVQ
jgi:hypothetical protein